MKGNRFLFFIGVFAVLAFAVPEEKGFRERLYESLLEWVQRIPQEKLYLHTDRAHYEAGEKVWFRAYLTSATTHRLSVLSRFVYVELRDLQDSLYARVKVPLRDSIFAGYMPLKKELPQGDYLLRAYSYWMQNMGDDYVFRKKIRVMNPQDTKVKTEVELERGDKGDVARLRFINSRQEPYDKVYVKYWLDDKVKVLRTDEEGVLRIKLDSADLGKKMRVSFNEAIPFAFERWVYLPDLEEDFDVAFMPEGGDLLTGCRQVVAYKAIGRDGLSRSVKGMIVDDKDNQITFTQTVYKGMGAFELTAEPGRRYYARFTCGDSVEKRFPLPEAKAEGVALRVNVFEDGVAFMVQASAGVKLKRDLYLVLHSRGVPIHCQPVKVGGGGKVACKDVPEGIAQFLLMDDEGTVYSRRLCFIRHADRPEVQVNPDRDSYLIRDTAWLEIAVDGFKGEKTGGSFSVAVTDDGQVAQDSLQDNILSSLLLTSDLKGHVEDPATYFVNNRVITRRYLDLLMLTQGWSRYDVSKVMKREFDKLTYYVERGQAISGRVKNFWGKDAEAASLILLGTNGTFSMVAADSAGRFVIDGIAFPDSTEFVLQGRNKKGRRNVEVVIDEDEYLKPTVQWPVSWKVQNGEDEFYKRFSKDYYYENGVKVYVLDEVVIKRRMEPKAYSFYDRMADYHLDSARLASMAGRDIRDVFREIPGVDVFGDSITRFGKPLHILVNDFEEDMDFVMRLMPEDLLSVSYIPSYRSAVFFGGEAKNGALVITTHPGFVHREVPRLDLVTFSLLGYQKATEFYMPHYEVDSVRLAMADTTDMRKTVYWNPDVRVDGTGKGRCFFTTSDSEGPYTVIVEGILQDGTICRKERKLILR